MVQAGWWGHSTAAESWAWVDEHLPPRASGTRVDALVLTLRALAVTVRSGSGAEAVALAREALAAGALDERGSFAALKIPFVLILNEELDDGARISAGYYRLGQQLASPSLLANFAQGRHHEALADLDDAARRWAALGMTHPNLARWRAPMARVLARLGRREAASPRPQRDRRAHAAGTPGGSPGRRGSVEPGGRRAVVRVRADRGDAPAACVPEARGHRPRRPSSGVVGRSASALTGAPRGLPPPSFAVCAS